MVFDNIWRGKWFFLSVCSMSYGVSARSSLCVMIRKIVSAVHGEWEKEVKLGDADWEFAYGKHGVSSWSPDAKPEAAAPAEAPAEQVDGGEDA